MKKRRSLEWVGQVQSRFMEIKKSLNLEGKDVDCCKTKSSVLPCPLKLAAKLTGEPMCYTYNSTDVQHPPATLRVPIYFE